MFKTHRHDECIDSALNRAEDICQEKGLRLTQLRKRVLELVWESHGPVKAYDILGKLDHKGSAAKPPTVYRSLEFLTQHGLVHKLNSLNAYVGCSHPSKTHACYFLICKVCDQVMECCNQLLTRAIRTTSDEHHFQVTGVTLEIEGVCEQCAGKARTAA